MLRLLLLGDWGKSASNIKSKRLVKDENNFPHVTLTADKNDNKKSNVFQKQVAIAMANFAEQTSPQPSFVITLGDNFYNNGVSNISDPLWNSLWKHVYLTNYTSLRIPWYPVLGNHDYGGGSTYAQAQVDRTLVDSDDDIWRFPAKNYAENFAIPGGGSLDIVFVDTTTLAPGENKCCNEKGSVSKDKQAAIIKVQLSNLERMFRRIRAQGTTWLLAVGHYPIFSAGNNGDTEELHSNLLPLLEKYRVDAYICGHDHISEHLRHNNIDYFVAGAGSMTASLSSEGSEGKLLWSGTGFSAFAYMNVTEDSLSIGYIDINGTERYGYSIYRPRQSQTTYSSALFISIGVVGAIILIVCFVLTKLHYGNVYKRSAAIVNLANTSDNIEENTNNDKDVERGLDGSVDGATFFFQRRLTELNAAFVHYFQSLTSRVRELFPTFSTSEVDDENEVRGDTASNDRSALLWPSECSKHESSPSLLTISMARRYANLTSDDNDDEAPKVPISEKKGVKAKASRLFDRKKGASHHRRIKTSIL